MTNTEVAATDLAPTATVKLRFVVTDPASPAGREFDMLARDLADAHVILGWYRNADMSHTAYASDISTGKFLGSGLAGGGRLNSDWA